MKIPCRRKMVKRWKCVTKIEISFHKNDDYVNPSEQAWRSLRTGGVWEVHARITILFGEPQVRSFSCNVRLSIQLLQCSTDSSSAR